MQLYPEALQVFFNVKFYLIESFLPNVIKNMKDKKVIFATDENTDIIY
jgi:hypothetical protein